MPVGAVREVLSSAEGYRPWSLSYPIGDGELDLGATLGAGDPGFDRVDDSVSLRLAMANMPDRLCRMVILRFYANMTQREIADQLGLSQMHVSRLLQDAYRELRKTLAGPDQPAAESV